MYVTWQRRGQAPIRGKPHKTAADLREEGRLVRVTTECSGVNESRMPMVVAEDCPVVLAHPNTVPHGDEATVLGFDAESPQICRDPQAGRIEGWRRLGSQHAGEP